MNRNCMDLPPCMSSYKHYSDLQVYSCASALILRSQSQNKPAMLAGPKLDSLHFEWTPGRLAADPSHNSDTEGLLAWAARVLVCFIWSCLCWRCLPDTSVSADNAAIWTCCQSAVETAGGCEVATRQVIHMTASFLKYTLLVATSYKNREMDIFLLLLLLLKAGWNRQTGVFPWGRKLAVLLSLSFLNTISRQIKG